MKKSTRSNLALIVRILIGLVYLAPILIAVIYSFHPNTDFVKTGVKLISNNLTFENYKYVVDNFKIWTYLKNTLVVAVVAIPVSIIITSFSAYAFTFFNFPLRNAGYMLYLTVLMIPAECVFLTTYLMVHRLNLINTYIALMLPYFNGIGSMILIRQSMLAVPIELWEAAKMDGCTKMKYYRHVMMPLCKPIITTQVITSFISIYNAYFWPLMVTTRDEWHTVQIGLKNVIMDNGGQYGYVLAGAVMSMVIPLALYLINQKRIITGMSAGAVKG